MLRFASVTVAIICLSLPSCQKADKRVNLANFEKVQPGMTRADIDSLLGKGQDDPDLALFEGSSAAAAIGVADPNMLQGGGTPALRWVKYGTDSSFIAVCFNREGKVHTTSFKTQKGLKK